MRRRILSLALVSVLALTACQSAEERAEEHFQSALALLEAKDEERALVELRNVFQLNGFHKEARVLYADLLRQRGQKREAYAQYLRLVEQYPDTLEVRQTLAEMSMDNGDWEEVARHGEAAVALAPEDPRNRTLRIALDYRNAILAKTPEVAAAAVGRARDLLAEMPDNATLRRVILDSLMTSGDRAAALTEVENLLKTSPDSLEFNIVRLRLLAEMNDQPAVGQQLRRLLELQPDDKEVQQSILQWHMGQNDLAGAKAFLKEMAGPDSGPADRHLDLVQFLRVTEGEEAALAELDRLIAATPGTAQSDQYRTFRAAMAFEAGQIDAALTQFSDLLKDRTDEDPAIRDIRSKYALVLDAKGDRAAAAAEVERILAADAGHVEALKLRAGWRIAEDKPGEAIIDLRAALDQSPRDASILTLMAEAHLREGAPELAGERLALAVEVSGMAAEESLRYAGFLMDQQNFAVAEKVLTDALRVAPQSLPLLAAQGELRIKVKDWPRTEETVAAMKALGGDEALAQAKRLEAAIAVAQERTSDALALLEGLVSGGQGGISTIAATVQTMVQAGNLAEARTFLDGEIARAPADQELKMLSANLRYMSGEVEAAEAELRALVAALPQAAGPVRMLYTVLANSDRAADAEKALDEGLARMPEEPVLLWIKAGVLERRGDVEGAIGIYEAIYARDSGNLIVANNLASLITTHRTDAESLERAYVIARRLRGSGIAAFQDTYGWIEFRRGNYDEALANLEPAARGLPDDMLTQFHLGMTFAALGRSELAKEQLEKFLGMAQGSGLAQVDLATQTIGLIAAAEEGARVVPPELAPKTEGN